MLPERVLKREQAGIAPLLVGGHPPLPLGTITRRLAATARRSSPPLGVQPQLLLNIEWRAFNDGPEVGLGEKSLEAFRKRGNRC